MKAASADIVLSIFVVSGPNGPICELVDRLVLLGIARQSIQLVKLDGKSPPPSAIGDAVMFCIKGAGRNQSALERAMARLELADRPVGLIMLGEAQWPDRLPTGERFRLDPADPQALASETDRIAAFVQRARPPSGTASAPIRRLASTVGGMVVELFRSDRIKQDFKQRASIVGVLLVLLGWFVDPDGFAEKSCKAPGIASICAQRGWGGLPTPEQQREWDRIPPGSQDCAPITAFIDRNRGSKSTLVRNAREIEQRAVDGRAAAWTSAPDEPRHGYILPTLAGFESEAEAQAATLAAAQREAVSLCKEGLDPQISRPVGVSRLQLDELQCSPPDAQGKLLCGAKYMASCQIEQRRLSRICFK